MGDEALLIIEGAVIVDVGACGGAIDWDFAIAKARRYPAADRRRGLRSLGAFGEAGKNEGERRSGPIFVGIRP